MKKQDQLHQKKTQESVFLPLEIYLKNTLKVRVIKKITGSIFYLFILATTQIVSAQCPNGTLVFKENFGGNSPSDPPIKPTGIPEVSYPYGIPGNYSIRKVGFYHPAGVWYQCWDHTFPTDPTRGYMLQVDATAHRGQFYEKRLTNLCAGTPLYFSAWLKSVLNVAHIHKANLIFYLYDANNNVIAQYGTGNLPEPRDIWTQYGFPFTVPNGLTELTLRIINNGIGTNGNDFVMDDIEIRICTDPIGVTANKTTLCSDEPLILTGTYTDAKGLFGTPLSYQWQHSTTGDINTPSDWTVVNSGTAPSAITINYTQNTPVGGYYRFVVANASNINSPNCRASSVPVHILVTPAPIAPIVAIPPDVCLNDKPNLVVTNSVIGTTYQVFNSEYGGQALTTAIPGNGLAALNLPFTTIQPAGTFTYYVEAKLGTCIKRTNVNQVINFMCLHNDTVRVYSKNTSTLDVLPNDLIAACGGSATVSISGAPSNSSATASVVGNKVAYNSTADFANYIGRDTLRYTVTCGSNTANAKVYLLVLRKPDMLLEAHCGFQPKLTIDLQYQNMTIDWQLSTDGGVTWTNLSTNYSIYPTIAGQYRVKLTHPDMKDTYTQVRELTILRDVLMPGNRRWYEVHLN